MNSVVMQTIIMQVEASDSGLSGGTFIFIILLILGIGLLASGFVRVNENEIAVVTTKFSLNNSFSKQSKYSKVAYDSPLGIQPDVICKSGINRYNWRMPLINSVQKIPVTVIEKGEIGLVIAKYGEATKGQRLGRVVECNTFQDAKQFFDNNGNKGQQLQILKPGRYEINTLLFDIITAKNAEQHGMSRDKLLEYIVEPDQIGIVETHDGADLPEGEIAGGFAEGHNKFRDPQAFIDAGGFMGVQEEVLTTGSYYLNPWFVTVKQVPLTKIHEGTVGVVVSSIGKTPEDEDNLLVDRGFKGIWKRPLMRGTHPINTDLMKVIIVPTNPIRLEWSDIEKPEINYDRQLGALKLRSSDAFSFSLELTQIIQIEPSNAPLVVSSIGANYIEDEKEHLSGGDSFKYDSIRSLVHRILAPTVSSYFRTSAQDFEAWDFHKQRGARNRDAAEYIAAALNVHGVTAVSTLIEDIELPDILENLLTRKKKAEITQITIAEERRQLEAQADYELSEVKAQNEKDQIRAVSDVEMAKLKSLEQEHIITAEVNKIEKIGKAENIVLKEKTQIQTDARRMEKLVEAEAYIQIKDADASMEERLVKILGADVYGNIKASANISNLKLPTNMYGGSNSMDAFLMRLMDNVEGKAPPRNDEAVSQGWEPLFNFLMQNPTQLIIALKSMKEYAGGEALEGVRRIEAYLENVDPTNNDNDDSSI